MPGGIAILDYDNDSRLDLFFTNAAHPSRLYRNLGNNQWQDVTTNSGLTHTGYIMGAAAADFDADGLTDLVVTGLNQNLLYRNLGQGRFTDVSAPSGVAAHIGKGMALAFADYDRDGWLDVLVTNDAVPNFLFRNNHTGTFTERGLAAGIGLNDDGRALSSMGADFRDINNDGSPDIFITALANETFPLFKSLPKGLFEDITYPTRIGTSTLAYSGWSTGIYDFDNDGLKDIFTANGDVNDNTELFSSRKSNQQNLLLWNTGKNIFRPEPIGTPARHRGAAFADFNNDGAIDIVTSSLGQSPTLWLNNRAKQNHWLIIETPLGAEVQIGDQHNQASQAVGYASSTSPQVHFGMGAATIVEKIEIRFPSGKTKTLTNQKTNQRIKVRE